MIPIKKHTNYLMDWNNPQDRINYFRNLRKFLSRIEGLTDPLLGNSGRDYCQENLRQILRDWNLYFIDVDEIPRVNLDEPTQ